MKLDFDTIKEITCGVSYLSKNGHAVQFHRFNQKEENYYQSSDYPRHYATSGVKLMFSTNSTKLRLRVFVSEATPTRYFSHDILVDGKKIGDIKNFMPAESGQGGPIGDFTMGDFEGEFSLGTGMKEVCIVFPWSVNSMLEEIELDEDATVNPVKRTGTIISYGDSITYGASATYPLNRYMARLTEALHMDEICKAVGGEIFCPELLSFADCVLPDYVVVSYGTNDMHCDFEDFKDRCVEFFYKISEIYKDASILAISPIWRIECETEEFFCKFKQIENVIRETAVLCHNVKYVNGYNLIPHDIQYFADSALHPNDEGFEYYANNLLKENIFKTGEEQNESDISK